MDMESRARRLEDAYFLKRDAQLIELRKEQQRIQKTKEELAKSSGISNPKVLDKLVELNITPNLLSSLLVLPLLEVAWADGELDAKEREAVLKASAVGGLVKGSLDYQLLESWLKEKPSKHFLDAWLYYMEGLREVLTQEELDNLKVAFLDRARHVAEAAGGFLGFGNKVSDKEQAVLKKMENAFKL